MSIRIKIISTIIISATTIIVFGIGAGLLFVQSRLEKTIEKDMSVVADIADKLISTEINLLKADGHTVIQHLQGASDDDFHKVLQQQTGTYNNFTALTVFDSNGIVDSYGIDLDGPALAPPEFIDSECMQSAFTGETVISTTQFDLNRKLVFYVCVPMGWDRVMVATVPGMYFSKIVSRFKIWQTGNIFILDATGTILANIRDEWVLQRFNFIEKAKTDKQYARIAETISLMIEKKTGAGRFAVDGEERLSIYRPISGSKVGWTLGVVAPLGESPIHDVGNGLLLVGAVCLLMSVMAAFLATVVLERPYKTISDLLTAKEAQSKLLYTINNAAAVLLGPEASHFENDIAKCMDMMGRSVGVDRMRVWQNSTEDGELYCSQLHEWSGGAESQAGKQITMNVPYSKSIPGWKEKLSAGQSLKLIASSFSPEEQVLLSPQGILSILVIPVFFNENFWGFVCFDDCHKEREFSVDEENLLRSGAVLIANAILRNEMTDDIVQAREEAIASTVAKSDFLANMSHEMRTPLNAIIGLSDLTLDSGDVGGVAEENLEKIYSSGVTLLSLINDILDISKIESGKFELIPVEYDTPSLINDTVTLNIVRIGSRPITFHLDVDKTLPSKLVGDELRIKQIFNNLLSNAFKYTQEGSVEWSIFCEQASDGDNMWLVSRIKDSGIGIRPEDMEKLFSEYNQVDTKSNRKIEGTGLGLSICKSMVEMMGGWITVESEYGKGSAFTVRIRQGKAGGVPIGPEVAENLRNFHYSEVKRDRSAKLVRTRIPYARVLIVDDVATNLDVARGMMKPYGMQIDCVTSGQAAVDLIREAKPTYNAIFMDHMMPVMDGIEAVRIIREEIGTEYAKNIPIIALTANAIAGNEDMFLSKGFQAFLSKPVDIMRMDFVINHYVRDKEREKKLEENARNGLPNNPDLRSGNDKKNDLEKRSLLDRKDVSDILRVAGLNIKKGLERFGGDEETYFGVLGSYALNTPSLLDQLRDCTPENLPNYAIVAHGVKSSSRSIGADHVGTLAEAFELAAKADDFSFVSANNDDFIKTIQVLIDALSKMLQDIADENPKPKKSEPDAETLAALLEACKSFDIDEVDKAMKELESHEYESGGDLVEWIRSQINVMGFKKIAERLLQR
jgi:signal transduction histidine kinase/CheY-like chemotaxis protein